MPDLPIIPEFITVHLGTPSSNAENVTVSFPDYIKNVASSEIYPTWPENALRANIYAQISFALNRVYTEYYRSRGYDFNITNSTAYDQSFIKGRDIFENIGRLVDELFNSYISRQGYVEPLFAAYCDGVEVQCQGLSQWGSVELANQGYTPYEILQYYYGEDININRDTPIASVTSRYPGAALRLGSVGNDVASIQTRLNRISTNYPNIPKINPADGVFGQSTLDAVLAFQRQFDLSADGIVGEATWNRIQYIYNAVKRLNELNSEGLTLSDIKKQFPEQLSEGMSGEYVLILQYMLAYVAQFEETINPIATDGSFGSATQEAVEAFQRTYELPITGVVDKETYDRLYDVYTGIVESLPDDMFENSARPFAGDTLTLGVESPEVEYLQEYLNVISSSFPDIPTLEVTGVYSLDTQSAVRIFQELAGLTPTGNVSAVTWNAVAEAYDNILAGERSLPTQFPGYTIKSDLSSEGGTAQ